jgi:hypothetical protein
MRFVPLDITEIVSSIIRLGGTRSESIPRSAIYLILWKLQPEVPLLSSVKFSITGDVCFSRDIERAINNLIVRGTLLLRNDSTVLVNDVPTLQALNHESRTRSHFQDLFAASRKFYKALGEWRTTVMGEMPEAG